MQIARRRAHGLMLLDIAAISGAVALALLFPLLLNHRFYFADDYQTYFLPMFVEIGRQLHAGVFPLVTDRIWHGGAILAEFQYAVLNPVCLLLYLTLDLFTDLAWAGAYYAIVHYAILAAGAYLLGVSIGLRRPESAVAAVLACSSTWLLYWGAQSWIPALVSISWVPCCLAALHRVYHDPRWLPAGSLATAMPLLSGWPFTTASLLILLAIALCVAGVGRAPLSRLGLVALAAVLGAGLALPAIVPTEIYLRHSPRAAAMLSDLGWQASLQGLLTVGLPSFFGPWFGFEGKLRFYAPSFLYLGWFVPLVIANARNGSRWLPETPLLAVGAVVFAILSISPGLLQLRWTFRFIPFLHLIVAILVACLLGAERAGGEAPQWRFAPTAAAIAIPFAIAATALPGTLPLDLMFAALAGVLAWLVTQAQARRKSAHVYALMLGGQAVFLALIVTTSPANTALPQWNPPTERPPVAGGGGASELALFKPTTFLILDRDYWRRLAVGNRGLLDGRTTINGYTPIGMRGLDAALCFNYISGSCPAVAEKLFERDATTGLALIDLLRVSRVVAERGDYADRFRTLAADRGWSEAAHSEATQTFSRRTPLTGDDSVAWASPGITAGAGAGNAQRRTLRIETASGFAGGELILAMPWYPGYAAELDGRALPVSGYRDMLVAVALPAGAHGTLVVCYWPAGLTAGLVGAALAATLLLILSIALFARAAARSAQALPESGATGLRRPR